MWKVLVLVCSVNLTVPCSPVSADTVVTVPESAPSLAMCGMVGQAYIAQTDLVGEGQTVRIYCSAGGGKVTG